MILEEALDAKVGEPVLLAVEGEVVVLGGAAGGERQDQRQP